ncbi:hypothetical protein PMIN06_005245 [Paraphaeosphaeria minitans]|uniref:Uncharacterized protein n=1 Tax=Paraphaeosphaeria minitans TaxID=565426 RepID=A0A9P6GP28_9PLEO|nr:hypothetical protein PMIN01_01855 [Paraphaeosphaeria minitans]
MSIAKLCCKIWLSDFFYLPAAALISHRVFETVPGGFVSDYTACIWGTALGTLIARAASIWFGWMTDGEVDRGTDVETDVESDMETDTEMNTDSKDSPASPPLPQQNKAAGLPEQARAA